MEKLLPCPFCSGEPKLSTESDRYTSMWSVISCSSCDLSMVGERCDDAPSCDHTRALARDALVARWNIARRHPEQQRERTERLEGALKYALTCMKDLGALDDAEAVIRARAALQEAE